jgi:hypothetical protein
MAIKMFFYEVPDNMPEFPSLTPMTSAYCTILNRETETEAGLSALRHNGTGTQLPKSVDIKQV